MKILAFDSTAKTASVALLDDRRMVALFNIDNGLTQSELLLPMAEDLLKRCKIDFDDIDMVCCSEGPGSFTGVRIAVALVKGIALGRDLPCVGVSTLEALCANAEGLSGIIVPVMDARRGQVYTAVFKSDDEGCKRVTEDCAIAITELYEKLSEFSGTPIYLVGDGYEVAYKGLSSLGLKLERTPELLKAQNAYSIGRLAYDKYKNGNFTKDTEISPTYLRVPQAERERLERIEKENAKDEK